MPKIAVYRQRGIDMSQATPGVVRVIAGLFVLCGVLNVGRVGFQAARVIDDASWSSGARAAFLMLNAFTVLMSVLFLVLAVFLYRGKLWAWITAITVVALALPWGVIWLLIQLVDDRFPWLGLIVLVPGLTMLLGLTVPGSARRFFLRKPAYQQAPWPGHYRPY